MLVLSLEEIHFLYEKKLRNQRKPTTWNNIIVPVRAFFHQILIFSMKHQDVSKEDLQDQTVLGYIRFLKIEKLYI